MAMKSKKTEMARLCWISIVAMLLLTSTILVTHAEAEAAAAKSNEELGSGRLAEGSAKATLSPLILTALRLHLPMPIAFVLSRMLNLPGLIFCVIKSHQEHMHITNVVCLLLA